MNQMLDDKDNQGAFSRLLVIDDDLELCQLLEQYLEGEHFLVESVHDGESGWQAISSGKYDIAVLDVMLPDVNGFEVLRRIRSECECPVIMLTARSGEVDRIVGLEIGADDYLPKPFNPRELVARIQAILRRSAKQNDGQQFRTALRAVTVGDVCLDPRTRTVYRGRKPVELTAVEFNLLEAMLRSAGQVVTRDELCRRVLGRDLSALDRSIDMHICQVRKKLGTRTGDNERIKTIRGVGYLYLLPAEKESPTPSI